MSETLTSPKSSSVSQPPRVANGFEVISLIVFIVIALIIAGLVSLDTGWTGIGLFMLGGLLGGVFWLSIWLCLCLAARAGSR